MEEKNILLLVQLVNGLQNSYSLLENSYNSSDKSNFDKAKEAILDIQKKIGFVSK